VPGPGEIPGKGGAMMEMITILIALALIVYLFISIFRPERF
jgi:K+-transporting ATPase KdpF subunit